MATAHQPLGHYRQRSRDTHREESALEPVKKPTKRLFSNRDAPSDHTDSSEYNGENGENTLPEGEYPSGKRHRTGNWPLTNTNSNNAPPARPRFSSESRRSPPRRSNSEQARSSRFIEGSMNDRVSRKPPSTYTGNDEELRETYDNYQAKNRKRSRSKKFTYHPNNSIAQSTSTDASRQSSIFRFGKSIAASFNPTNWKIWTKEAEEEDVLTDEQVKLKERQEKAARIYQELKSTGYFQDGAHSGSLQRGAESAAAAAEAQKASARSAKSAKHDSGIALGSDPKVQPRSSSVGPRRAREPVLHGQNKMSMAEKRMGRVFLEHEGLPEDIQGVTPKSVSKSVRMSETSSRKSFQFTRPSLHNIRKSFDKSSAASDLGIDNDGRLQKVPSRKDLQRQQKLVKKVSDLEGKLEAARRQLSEAMAEPIPMQPVPRGRSRFVPGALATLPSERLLSGYVSNDSESPSPAARNLVESPSNIGKAITIDPTSGVHTEALAPESSSAIQQSVDNSASYELPSAMVDETVQHPPQLDKPLPEPLVSLEELATAKKPDEKALATKTTVRRNEIENAPSVSEFTSSEFLSQSIETDYSENETGLTRQLSKKRKSSFEGLANDGGQYKPPSESSDDEDYEPIKKRTPPKKRARKIPSTPDLKKAQPQNQRQHAARHHSTKKPASVMGPLSSSKSKIPRKPIAARQSASPPPSAAFTGLDNIQTSKAFMNQDQVASRNVLQDDVGAYSATPGVCSDEDVPPMPKLPSAFRAAASQVFEKTEKSLENRNLKNNTGKPQEMRGDPEKQPLGQESFEWDEDVF